MELNNSIKEVLEKQSNSIEEKIKELIKPYIDIGFFVPASIKVDLELKGYKLESFACNDVTEYRITYIPSGKYDYFTKKDGEIVKGEEFKFSINTYISDIIRGID